MQYTDILKYVNSNILWAYDVDNQQISWYKDVQL
jgi:hypothetical protein